MHVLRSLDTRMTRVQRVAVIGAVVLGFGAAFVAPASANTGQKCDDQASGGVAWHQCISNNGALVHVWVNNISGTFISGWLSIHQQGDSSNHLGVTDPSGHLANGTSIGCSSQNQVQLGPGNRWDCYRNFQTDPESGVSNGAHLDSEWHGAGGTNYYNSAFITVSW